MQIFMNGLSRVLSMLSVILLIAGFILLIRQIKKSNHMSKTSHLLSISFSLILLLFNVLVLKSAKISWWFVFPLILGAGFGFAWGTTTRLKIQDDHITGKRSVLYICFWLVSILVTQVLAFFAKTNVVAFGLAGMFFSTGASLGTNSNILYRMRKLNRASLSSLKEKSTYDDVYVDESGLKSVRIRQKIGTSEVQSTHEKTTVEHKRKPGHVIFWLSGGLASLLLIIFLFVRFGFPDRILSLITNNEDLEQGDKFNDTGSKTYDVIQETPIVIAQSETSKTQQNEESALVTPLAESGSELQPKSGDVLLFAEDFNSTQLSATPLFNIEYMRYYHAEGQGVVESAVHPGLLPIFFKQIRTDDFIAEFDFMMPDASYDSSCGFLFRSNATTKEGLDQYYALFLFPKTNVLKMGIFKDNELSFSPAIEPDPRFHLGYETNHIRLEVKGENMDIYLNGIFVTGFSEGSLRDPGWIGFFLYPSDFLSVGEVDYVLFDNLMIYKN